MGPYLIDSNTFIDYLGDVLPDAGDVWVEDLFNSKEHFSSVINRMEVLSFNAPEQDLYELTELFTSTTVILLTAEIEARTILLRRLVKIKIPDAIVAATALVHNLTLVTRNTDDFKNVPGLTVVNPHDIT